MNRRFDRVAGHRADGGIDGGVFKDGVIRVCGQAMMCYVLVGCVMSCMPWISSISSISISSISISSISSNSSISGTKFRPCRRDDLVLGFERFKGVRGGPAQASQVSLVPGGLVLGAINSWRLKKRRFLGLGRRDDQVLAEEVFLIPRTWSSRRPGSSPRGFLILGFGRHTEQV